jgi:hypothetical protein
MHRFGQSMAVALKLDPESLPALGELAMDKWADISALLGIQPDVSGAGSRLPSQSIQAFSPNVHPVCVGLTASHKGWHMR